jgi:hypothetical protein
MRIRPLLLFVLLAVVGFALRRARLPVAAYVLAAGAFLAAIGGYGLSRQLRLQRRGERVTGIVVGHDQQWVAGQSMSNPGSYAYRPVVRFRTRDGQEIEATTRVGTPVGIRPGREVPVLYDPANPSSAEIDAFRERGVLNLMTAVFLIGGVVLMVVGAATLLHP